MNRVTLRFIPVMLVGLILLAGLLPGCSGSKGAPQQSTSIYELNAKSGSLSFIDGDSSSARFRLTFNSVANVNWFSDRPIREAGVDTIANLINVIWPREYGATAPNAVLEGFYGARTYIQMFSTLEKPVYDPATGRLSFNITVHYVEGNQGALSPMSLEDLQLVILNNAPAATTQWSELVYGDTLKFTAEPGGTYTLRVSNLYGSVYGYTSAPARNWMKTPVKAFLDGWQSRFGSNPPNVAIMSTGANNSFRLQIVALSSPAYNQSDNSVTFAAVPVYGAITPGETLSDVELFIDSAGKYSPADLEKLKTTKSCEGCDLKEAPLAGLDLSNALLKNADLSSADMSGTILKNADLSGATLTGATIDKANMLGATMTGAIGPAGMPGRVINLVNNCGIDIWAAASGNTAGVKCTSNADCNSGVCSGGSCTLFPCATTAECTATNSFCGGVPSFQKMDDNPGHKACTQDSDCGKNKFCNKDSGLCGWKNCNFVPIPVEKSQVTDKSCTSNGNCPDGQFCYTTSSSAGKCSKTPDSGSGNSWLLKSNETTPLFVPTPWAGRFWPRTGCAIAGSICDPKWAGSVEQCKADMVNELKNDIAITLGGAEKYPVKCRKGGTCGASPANTAILGGVCITTDSQSKPLIPSFTKARPDKSECTTDDQCNKNGDNWTCWNWDTSGKPENWFGQCGYYECSAYKCGGRESSNACSPATFTCDTGSCSDDKNQPAKNCRVAVKDSPTLAELNMQHTDTDYYDISLVDGGNVPLQIAPVQGTYTLNPATTPEAFRSDMKCATDDDCYVKDDKGNHKLEPNWMCDVSKKYCVNKFYCGSPGCASDCNGYGITPTAPSAWGGRDFAIAKDDCKPELRLTKGNTKDGAYLGCLAPKDACSTHYADWRSALKCSDIQDVKDSVVNKDDKPFIDGKRNLYSNLYACDGLSHNSCYTSGAAEYCCGCPPWMPEQFCASTNKLWTDQALPYFKLFHAASPTSYTFPYDDKASTFTCRGTSDDAGQKKKLSGSSYNNVNYNIIFCPK